MQEQKGWLHRGNVRDVVILVAIVISLFNPVNSAVRTTIGFTLLAFGVAVHLLVKAQLVRNVIICNEGFYGLVRHPYYLASFIIDSSFCVLSGSELLLYCLPFLFFYAYGPVIDREELALEEAHGAVYRSYRSNKAAVFPSQGSWFGARKVLRGFSTSRITLNEVKRIIRLTASATLLGCVDTAGALNISELLTWPPAPEIHRRIMIYAGLTLVLVLIALVIPKRRRMPGELRKRRTI